MIEVQDIFREHSGAYLLNHTLSKVQAKTLRDIINCRTAALGGRLDTCNECGNQVISYNSCRNRHCPKWQTLKKEQWIEKQEQNFLNVRYFQ